MIKVTIETIDEVPNIGSSIEFTRKEWEIDKGKVEKGLNVLMKIFNNNSHKVA